VGAEFRGHPRKRFGQIPAAVSLGPPPRMEPKPGAMPADHGVGLHDGEDVGPPGLHTAQGRPEPQEVGKGCSQPIDFTMRWGCVAQLLDRYRHFVGGDSTSITSRDLDAQ
jgi:hypothetical protein